MYISTQQATTTEVAVYTEHFLFIIAQQIVYATLLYVMNESLFWLVRLIKIAKLDSDVGGSVECSLTRRVYIIPT